jgi:hypothetical protein
LERMKNGFEPRRSQSPFLANPFLYFGFFLFGCIAIPVGAQTLLYENFEPPVYTGESLGGAALAMYAPIGFGSTYSFSLSTTNTPAGDTQTLQAAVNFTEPFNLAANQGIFQIEVASQYAPGGQNGGGTVEPFDASSATITGALSIELYATVATSFNVYVADSSNHTPPSGPWTHETMYATAISIPGGSWTDVILPLVPADWDSNFSTVNWNSIISVFIDAQAPPCEAAFTGGNYSETINYGTIEFIQDLTGPTPTPVNTPSYPCNTSTPTVTPTPTFSPTFTSTSTPTITPTPVFSFTPTYTFTPVNTSTPVFTATPVPPLNVWPNPFNPNYAVPVNGVGPALRAMTVPANSTMNIYTVSGELVAHLSENAPGEIDWNGKNNNGVPVSAGPYYYVIQSGNTTLLTGRVLVITSK